MADHSIPDGALRVHNQFGRWGEKDRRSLVIVRHTDTSERYGAEYIQDPESAKTGGSGWWFGPECFRLPTRPDELLKVQQYLTAKRVIDLEAELREARADVEAVARWADMMKRWEGSDG